MKIIPFEGTVTFIGFSIYDKEKIMFFTNESIIDHVNYEKFINEEWKFRYHKIIGLKRSIKPRSSTSTVGR